MDITSIKSLQNCILTSIQDIIFPLIPETLHHNFPKFVQPSKAAGSDIDIICFSFAKPLNMKPELVADLLATKLTDVKLPLFTKIKTTKASVNLTLSTHILAAAVIGEYIFPRAPTHNTNQIVLEFSSPNTNKPLHLGHVRNNCLGEAIANMLTYAGNNVTKINLVNDRGIHICKSMVAWLKFGKGTVPGNTKGDHFVGEYYVAYESAIAREYNEWLNTEEGKGELEKWKMTIHSQDFKDYYSNNFSNLGKEANEMLVKWEAGDSEVRALWGRMNSWVFSGFDQTYKRYGVNFTSTERESNIYTYGKDIVTQGVNMGILEKADDGAIMVDLATLGLGDQKKVLLRANGTSVYMTQDIGTAAQRLKTYNSNKFIYVVADEQNRHFQILFGLMEKLYPQSKGMWQHLSYGLVMLPTGRMKSREGTAVDADDLADTLVKMTEKIIREKSKNAEITPEEISHRAEKIAMAAIKYYILSMSPSTTITFNPDESLQFKGKSGTYMLYQYVRTRSIIKKSGLK